MKIAVMQPYIFPYIGYFRLINASDKFIVLDDVNYIKKGWINRNRILVNKKENFFTIPLSKPSQNRIIKKTEISGIPGWRAKFLKTIETSYSASPYFPETFEIIKSVILSDKKIISDLILTSLKLICEYTGIKTKFIESSEVYSNSGLKNQQRIIDICRKESAEVYINAAGGRDLYSADSFKKEGIRLNFLESKPLVYEQFGNEFIPDLSIIDVLMFNPKERVYEYLNDYELI